MTYLPLYRKYRPKNLQEIVGQEHIKQALKNAIELGKISHAYLFTGPRGTGKTSTARILAKSLNCQKGITTVPCEECPSCLDIKNSNPIDVIEIDAASNRSVDDARNILEKVQYVPVNGRFKIYIIDEVHMLTKEAFNTLLKTLEEPPENVIFILATTEIQKVLETIVSRCQRFDFRRISSSDIFKHLQVISEKENIDIEDDALRTIAKTSSGGMRDALSLLDQVSVLNKKITVDDINSVLGRISFEKLDMLFSKIENSNINEALEFVESIFNSGNDALQILTNLLGYLKNLIIAKNSTNKDLLIELTQLNESQIKTLQNHDVETHQISFLIEKTTYYIKELKTNTNLQLWLEVAIIDIANLTNNTKLIELQDRISKLESGTIQTNKTIPATLSIPKIVETEKPQKKEVQEIKTIKKVEEVPTENENITKQEEITYTEGSSWNDLLSNISSQPTVSLLNQHCVPIKISEEQIIIGCKEIFVKMVSNDSKKKAIADGAKKLFGKEIDIIIKALSTDEISEIEKKNKEKITKPKEIQIKKEKTEIEENEENEENEELHSEIIKENIEEKTKINTAMQSDQVSRIMTLFNGKLID
jgi:DNA polymerase-3 subunit gamma/tau